VALQGMQAEKGKSLSELYFLCGLSIHRVRSYDFDFSV